MTENMNSKDCPYCGKSLPLAAIFCYYCQRELVTRPERPDAESKPGSSSWVMLVVIIVVAIVGYLIITSG
mgnify:CR=1 FL=1